MIKCESLNLLIRGKQIVRDVSLSFQRGMIHGIVGRNGSGKTMLLKMLSGYLQPTSGRILIDDKELYTDIAFPPSMGLIIESPSFSMFSTGLENLTYLAGIQGKAKHQDILSALETVELTAASGKLVRQYSLGMRQRLGIAQAIMEDPLLLLLDEPFNGLDKAGLQDMHRLMTELRQKGKTILLATHSPIDILELCDTVSEFDRGVLIRTNKTPQSSVY